MGAVKNYLCTLIAETTSNVLEADALEYAIYCGWFNPTMNLTADKLAVAEQLPALTQQFRSVAEENQQVNAPMQELLAQIGD